MTTETKQATTPDPAAEPKRTVTVTAVNVKAGKHVVQPKKQKTNTWPTLAAWTKEPGHLYCGRHLVFVSGTFSSPFRNPVAVGKKATLDQALDSFTTRVTHQNLDVQLLQALEKMIQENPTIDTIQLGCWCHPAPCHVHVLLRAMATLLEGGRAVLGGQVNLNIVV